jgi:hypothetical protein
MEDAMFSLESLFNSIGEVSQVFTVVDYYQYIKGLEYLICLAFFIIFPMFYRFIHNEKRD